MTKTNNKKSTTNTQHRLPLYRRAWFLALIIIIVIAVIVYLIILFVKPDQATTSSDSKIENQTTETSSNEKSDQIDDGQHINEDEPYSDPDQITTQYEGENPNRASDLSGSITYTDYTNGIFSVGTMIDQYLSDGSCTLKLTGTNGNTYTVTSNIVAAASTSACYDLSVSAIPDTYQIEITLSSGNKQGIITGEYRP